jgi:mannose-1-phosphate guanylyltransferase
MRLRALVLAAGLGQRLRPLTEVTPKPLLPVCGLPILGHSLRQLAAVGCEAVAVNVHHLGGQIRERFGNSFAGMPLHWSEEPEILGTLGALHPLRDFLGAADLVLLVNGDSLCRWPLRQLVRRHLERGAQATLMLTARPDPARFGGGVGIDREGDVLSFHLGAPERGEVARRHVFAGAHVLSPDLLERVGPGRADIVPSLYVPLLQEEGGRIASLVSSRPWHDLGTPQRLLEGTLDWARGGWPARPWRRSWVSAEAAVERGARLRRASLEAGARVGAGARIERSILLPGARVGEGCTVREAIVGPGAEVPAGTWVERRIVMPRREGAAPGPGDSVVGDAVYTPFPSAEP